MTYSVDPGEVEKGQAAQNASTRQVGTGRRIGFWARLTNIFRVENKVAQVHGEDVDPTPDSAAHTQGSKTQSEREKKEDPQYTQAEIDNASSKMWGIYVGEAERYDRAVVDSWKGDMNGMLIFSGLFSASLTAFLIESYKTLQPDSGDTTVVLLAQISLQLASASTEIAEAPPFERTTAALICNVLWFISLSLSLTCSLLATLVEQWAREFLHKTEMRPAPVRRARVFSFLYLGIKQFHMHTVVDVIPLLLHLSLFLFFGGLIAFLSPVNDVLMYLMGIILAVFFGLYMLLTVLPVVRRASPYRTPLSNALWRLKWRLERFLTKLSGNRSGGSPVDVVETGDDAFHMPSMTEVVTIEALENTHDRDAHAVQWTVMSLTDDEELLPFVESIPSLIHGPKGFVRTSDHLFLPLLNSSDPQLSIGRRIGELLRGSNHPSLESEAQNRRRTASLKALWALGMISGTGLSQGSQVVPFDESIVWNLLHDYDHYYAISVRAAVMFGQLNSLRRCIEEAVCIYRKSDITSEASRLESLRRIHQLLVGIIDTQQLPSPVQNSFPLMSQFQTLRDLLAVGVGTGQTPIRQTWLALEQNLATIASARSWARSRTDIATDFLSRALHARSCPYMFWETCEEILADLEPWGQLDSHAASADEFPIVGVYFPVPDPKFLGVAPLTIDNIHDVDKIMKVILQHLAAFHPRLISNSSVWQYIAHREGDHLDYIFRHCDKETLLRNIIADVEDQVHLTAQKDIDPDLQVTICRVLYSGFRSMPSLRIHSANELYRHLRNTPFSPATACVKTYILNGLSDELSKLSPPLSLENMDTELHGIQNHPLLQTYYPNCAPFDLSVPVPQAKERLARQIREIRLLVMSEALSGHSTFGEIYYDKTHHPIILLLSLNGLWTQRGGPVGFQAQQIFAEAVRTGVNHLATTLTDNKLARSLSEVWDALHWSKWVEDASATSAAILMESLDLYLVLDLPKNPEFEDQYPAVMVTDRAEEPPRALRARCCQIIGADARSTLDFYPHFLGMISMDSPTALTEAPEPTETVEFTDPVSRVRAKLHLSSFLVPTFP